MSSFPPCADAEVPPNSPSKNGRCGQPGQVAFRSHIDPLSDMVESAASPRRPSQSSCSSPSFEQAVNPENQHSADDGHDEPGRLSRLVPADQLS
jgi:hypothetical protein